MAEKKKTGKKKTEKKLTEKEKLFCQIYIKNFNAAMAARKAGYSSQSANVIGYENLTKPHIRAEITRLKKEKTKALMLDKDDIIEQFMRIAFSDITDFLEFGREEVPVMTMFGPMEVLNPDTGQKEKVTKVVNTVKFKECTDVDGGIISQVKQGKEGSSIKLEDKIKALEWLANYFEMNPMDKHKRYYDKQKLELEKDKWEAEKQAKRPLEQSEDDGFIDALNSVAGEVWDGEDAQADGSESGVEVQKLLDETEEGSNMVGG